MHPVPPHLGVPPWEADLRVTLILAMILLGASAGAAAQRIVKVPQSEARVSRPDVLFSLAPRQWHFARHLWEGPAPCTPSECEGGYTSGDLVISVEHSREHVRIMAGFRSCEAVGHSEVQVGAKPGKSTFSRVRKQTE